ncbi:alkaline phosphatase D family protein [bacterium]|nr:alkaline phosphatase D family protein [bacterium]
MRQVLSLIIIFATATAGGLTSRHAAGQHDPGRDAMKLLAKDKFKAGAERLAKPPKSQNSPISEAERNFVLAIFDCRQGNQNQAIDHLQTAVSLGLPIERILAGPRELFEPLQKNESYAKWLAEKQKPLLHGPMLTSVTDTAAQIWVRTAQPTQVGLSATTAGPNSKPLPECTTQTSAADDYTGIIHLRDLKPNTQYQYQLSINGQPQTKQFKFRTMPKSGESAKFEVGFGGGAGYTPQFNHMWTTLGKQAPAAFLMMGDNVYIDDPTHPMTQRYCYYRRQSEPQWKSFIASTAMYSIYDDHDFGVNDCIPGPEIDEPAWKRPVWQVFKQNWNNPGFGGGEKQPGCWYDFQIADVHFIMLDGRYYRDLKGGSMLGPVQKEWLLTTLKNSTATFKILASPVPWSPGVKPGSKDTWDGFNKEREQIFSFVHTNQIDGVILLAADRHRSDLRRIPRQDGYDFNEVMSSRLTNVHTHSLVEGAAGSEFVLGYNEKCSFGLLSFDTMASDPMIKYTIINIDGEEVGNATLKLSDMKNR